MLLNKAAIALIYMTNQATLHTQPSDMQVGSQHGQHSSGCWGATEYITQLNWLTARQSINHLAYCTRNFEIMINLIFPSPELQ
jgi:hypothetical protein